MNLVLEFDMYELFLPSFSWKNLENFFVGLLLGIYPIKYAQQFQRCIIASLSAIQYGIEKFNHLCCGSFGNAWCVEMWTLLGKEIKSEEGIGVMSFYFDGVLQCWSKYISFAAWQSLLGRVLRVDGNWGHKSFAICFLPWELVLPRPSSWETAVLLYK